jgi:peptidoglycan hydrolase-like protein with peptidoglycan-binding domain
MVELPSGGTLRAGQTGTAVLRLQNALTALGFQPGKPDGIFGNTTAAAVISFQKANDLDPDGVVGEETAKKLNVALGAQDGSR